MRKSGKLSFSGHERSRGGLQMGNQKNLSGTNAQTGVLLATPKSPGGASTASLNSSVTSETSVRIDLPVGAVDLLRHQDLKEKLFEKLELHQERLATLVESAKVEMESQDEHIKRSVINRKLIASLRLQVREQRMRRDRLVHQRRTQKHAIVQTMITQVDQQNIDIRNLEVSLEAKERSLSFKRAKYEALQQAIDEAKRKSESVWRSGNRSLTAPKTTAEIKASSMEIGRNEWLDILKGGRDTNQKRLGAFESSKLRKKNANEFLQLSKERSKFYENEFADPDGNADAQFRTIKEVQILSTVAENFLEKQKRAIAEIRYIQGLNQLEGSPLAKWDEPATEEAKENRPAI